MPAEPASITPDVAGLLLAGGRSSRMGSNKALLALPEGSACTFVERLASLLSEICAETFLVTRDEINAREYVFASPDAKVRLIYDHIPDQGPLMALYSGLQATSCSHTLVLAVD
ncbi:MAG TPA: NTP transferase domain-containing protein, partial [Ktedonobacteraceae bacterium]